MCDNNFVHMYRWNIIENIINQFYRGHISKHWWNSYGCITKNYPVWTQQNVTAPLEIIANRRRFKTTLLHNNGANTLWDKEGWRIIPMSEPTPLSPKYFSNCVAPPSPWAKSAREVMDKIDMTSLRSKDAPHAVFTVHKWFAVDITRYVKGYFFWNLVYHTKLLRWHETQASPRPRCDPQFPWTRQHQPDVYNGKCLLAYSCSLQSMSLVML